MNYLDRSNLTAAYVSGMKKDLAFEGNQFNQINTVFTVGYVMYRSQKYTQLESINFGSHLNLAVKFPPTYHSNM
jgi:hypothetical protein